MAATRNVGTQTAKEKRRNHWWAKSTLAKYYDKMLQKDLIRWQFQGISCSRKLEYSKVGIALCKCHNCEMKQGTDLARRFLRDKPPVKRRFWGAGMKKPLLPWQSQTLRKFAQIHVMACTLIFHKKDEGEEGVVLARWHWRCASPREGAGQRCRP